MGSQLFGSEEEEVGLDSGVGDDSDKVDSEAAAPSDTNQNQVLDLLKTHIIYLLSQNFFSKFAHRVTTIFSCVSSCSTEFVLTAN